MNSNDFTLQARFLRGLSNKVRLTILELLKVSEMTVNEIVSSSKMSQSSISQHLSCLKECGLGTARQDGKYIYYQIKNPYILELLSLVDHIVEETKDDIITCKYHNNLRMDDADE